MKMLRYRRPLRLLPLHRHQFRPVVDLSLFLRAGPSSKPVSTGGGPQDEPPHGVKRVGDEDAPAPSTPDAPGSDEADSEDKPTKNREGLQAPRPERGEQPGPNIPAPGNRFPIHSVHAHQADPGCCWSLRSGLRPLHRRKEDRRTKWSICVAWTTAFTTITTSASMSTSETEGH